MKTIIIGTGGVSYMHAPALQEIGVDIVGAYDINPDSAKRFADKFGTKALQNIDETLPEADTVCLFTPPSERVAYAEKAMNAGKHLYIEKPISITTEDCDRILACAKKNGVKLIVGFNHRYREGYRLLQEAVLSGKLGQPINLYAHRFGIGAGFRGKYITNTWRTNPSLACGMSIESLSHDINMLLSLVKGIKSVAGTVNCTIPELPEFDNNSNVVFVTKEGAIGNINSSWSTDLQYSARGFIGTKGSAVIRGNGLWDFDEFVIKTDDMPYEKVYKVGELFSTTAHQSYVNIHSHFVDCIQNGKEPDTPGQEGKDALLFSRAILESAKTGHFVFL